MSSPSPEPKASRHPFAAPDSSLARDTDVVVVGGGHAGVEAVGVEIQVLDDDGRPVAKDGKAVGEICARGNVVFDGYWEQPEETAKCVYDGYFHTGDKGKLDANNNLVITGRIKEILITSGGENVEP